MNFVLFLFFYLVTYISSGPLFSELLGKHFQDTECDEAAGKNLKFNFRHFLTQYLCANQKIFLCLLTRFLVHTKHIFLCHRTKFLMLLSRNFCALHIIVCGTSHIFFCCPTQFFFSAQPHIFFCAAPHNFMCSHT